MYLSTFGLRTFVLLLYVGKCSNLEVGMCFTFLMEVYACSTQFSTQVRGCSTQTLKFACVLLNRWEVSFSSTYFSIVSKCSTVNVLQNRGQMTFVLHYFFIPPIKFACVLLRFECRTTTIFTDSICSTIPYLKFARVLHDLAFVLHQKLTNAIFKNGWQNTC